MTGLHEVELVHPMWAPTVAYVAARGYTTGAPKPHGVKGGLGCHYFVLADGRIRWKLVYRERDTRKQTQVAKWISDWLPDARKDRQAPPCKTHGKIVTVDGDDRLTNNSAKAHVVIVDNEGLPVSVHIEKTMRHTAQQLAAWLRSRGVTVDVAQVEQVQRVWAL